MFGSRVGVVMVPFLKLSDITSPVKLGTHSFLGGSQEKNGVIYTRRRVYRYGTSAGSGRLDGILLCPVDGGAGKGTSYQAIGIRRGESR